MKGETPDTGVERVPSTGSTPETAGRGSPRWAQGFSEGGLLPAVRKQLETLEQWVTAQLARNQQQNEILVERSLRRLEARTQTLEAEVPRLEMSSAQLKGGVKGLADEFASQAHRMDALETRQWEWRQTVEEHFRVRLGEFERQVKNCATNAFKQSAALEEMLQKQGGRLVLLEEREGGADLGARRLRQLEEHAEVVSLEVERLGQALEAVDAYQASGLDDAQWEQRAAGVAARIDPFLKELGSTQALAQEQGVKLDGLRVSLEVQERRTQCLAERLETIDIESQLQRVHDVREADRREPQIYAAAVQVQAEQWLHSEDEPVRTVGIFSSSGRATPLTPRTPRTPAELGNDGSRELLGLSDNIRLEECSEDGDEQA